MADQTFTSGQILTAAQMTTLQTNIGLTYITSATATSGTSLSINGCFTSAYRNYRVVISNLTTTAAAASILRLRSGGTDNSSAVYYYNGTYMAYNLATINGLNGSAVTNWEPNIVTDTTVGGGIIDILNPFVAFTTTYSAVGQDPRTGGGGMRYASGVHYANTSFDGFTFTSGSTITNITITVYGYR
jgi:hypothetical protein